MPYHYALHRMPRLKRLASSLLFAAGIVLVFAGLSAALGFTALGMLASVGLIAALLYAGGTWFGGAPTRPGGGPVLVFDATLTLVSGAPLLAQFPAALHDTLRAHCVAALAGERTQFAAGGRTFDATPIVAGDGRVLYAALIERSQTAAAAGAAAVHANVIVR
ncbi:MAG TPA: hypothetical protein VM364_18510 [Vicinamibacterales bacterium]|nr:hypothetical protein [Vicinamibacterales bacterium]